MGLGSWPMSATVTVQTQNPNVAFVLRLDLPFPGQHVQIKYSKALTSQEHEQAVNQLHFLIQSGQLTQIYNTAKLTRASLSISHPIVHACNQVLPIPAKPKPIKLKPPKPSLQATNGQIDIVWNDVFEELRRTSDLQNSPHLKVPYDLHLRRFKLEFGPIEGTQESLETEDLLYSMRNLPPNKQWNVQVKTLAPKPRGGKGDENLFLDSDYSEPLHFQTPKMVAPTLQVSSQKTSQKLTWTRCAHAMDYVLEMYGAIGRLGSLLPPLHDPSGALLPNAESLFSLHSTVVYEGTQTSYLQKGLEPGQTYWFRIKARAQDRADDSEWGRISRARTQVTVPGSPPAMKVMGVTSTSIRLRWEPPNENGAEVTEYTLQVSRANTDAAWMIAYCGADVHCTLSKLEKGTNYKIRIKAANSAGYGTFSQHFSAFTLSDSPEPPSAPWLSSKASRKQNSLAIRWDPPSSDNGCAVQGYVIEMSDVDERGPYSQVAQTDRATCTHQVEGLEANTQYWFRVAARNDYGVGAFSGATPLSTLPSPPSAPGPPIGTMNGNGIDFHWEPAKDLGSPILWYELQWKGPTTPRGEFFTLFKGPRNQAFLDSRSIQVAPSAPYQVRVCAGNKLGSGPWSAAVPFLTNALPPECPAVPELLHTDQESAMIQWQTPELNDGRLIGFILEVTLISSTLALPVLEGSGGGGSGVRQKLLNVTSPYVIRNLQPSSVYTVRLQCSSTAGKSKLSLPLSMKTKDPPPSPPSMARLVKCTQTSLEIEWTNNNGVGTKNENVKESTEREADLNTIAASTVEPLEDGEGEWEVKSAKKKQRDSTSAAGKRQRVMPQASAMVHKAKKNLEFVVQMLGNLGLWLTVYAGPSTRCTLDDLDPGSEYTVRVQAVELSSSSSSSSSSSDWSPEVTFSTAAPPPFFHDPSANLTLVSATYSSLKLEWDLVNCLSLGNITGDVNYELDMQESLHLASDGSEVVLAPDGYQSVYNGPATTRVIRSLKPETDYVFRVRAHTMYGTTEWSEHFLSTTLSPPLPPSPPQPPAFELLYPPPKAEVRVSWSQDPDTPPYPHGDVYYILERTSLRGGGMNEPMEQNSGVQVQWDVVLEGSETSFLWRSPRSLGDRLHLVEWRVYASCKLSGGVVVRSPPSDSTHVTTFEPEPPKSDVDEEEEDSIGLTINLGTKKEPSSKPEPKKPRIKRRRFLATTTTITTTTTETVAVDKPKPGSNSTGLVSNNNNYDNNNFVRTEPPAPSKAVKTPLQVAKEARIRKRRLFILKVALAILFFLGFSLYAYHYL